MIRPGAAVSGCLLGLLLGALAVRLRSSPTEAAPEAPAPAPRVPAPGPAEDPDAALRLEIAAAKRELAALADPLHLMELRRRPAREAANRLGAVMADPDHRETEPPRLNREIVLWLEGLLWENDVGDFEIQFHPERDRLLADYLEGMGNPLTPGQRAAFDEWIAGREQGWRDYLARRASLLPLERALHLVRADEDAAAARDRFLNAPQREALSREALVVVCNCETIPLALGPGRVPRMEPTTVFMPFEDDPEQLVRVFSSMLALGFVEDRRDPSFLTEPLTAYVRDLVQLPGGRPDEDHRMPRAGYRPAQLELQIRLQRTLLEEASLTEGEKERIREWGRVMEGGW